MRCVCVCAVLHQKEQKNFWRVFLIRPGLGKNKIILEYLSERESKNILRVMGHVRIQWSAKRHERRFKGTPAGQIWNNLSIRINNDNNM